MRFPISVRVKKRICLDHCVVAISKQGYGNQGVIGNKCRVSKQAAQEAREARAAVPKLEARAKEQGVLVQEHEQSLAEVRANDTFL